MKENRQNLRKIFQPTKNLKEQDFQRYLGDEMSANERFDIENSLLDDPFLADAMEGFEENNYDFSKSQPFQNVEGFLSKMEAANEAKVVQMQPRFNFRRIAIAASVAILFTVGAYFFSSSNNLSNQDLFAQHYTSFESDLPNFRGGVDDEVTIIELLNRGMQEYVNGNFEDSLPFFADFLKEDPNSPIVNFYAGLASLESGKAKEAINYLKVTSAAKGVYAEKADWYIIMANLKNENREAATSLLKKYIERGSSFNQGAAQTLLKKL